MCGEHLIDAHCLLCLGEIHGIIPACAGNTLSRRDHLAADLGSSPRVRGTLAAAFNIDKVNGIIPACAGNTSTPSDPPLHRRDHPRVCGEHLEVPSQQGLFSGSSPRVRGTPGGARRENHRIGIIPACAGNTLITGESMVYPRDHPRVCGEHLSNGQIGARHLGSSPRVRGTPYLPLQIIQRLGIIPACAGNTYDRASKQPVRRDHPRVCGEHSAYGAVSVNISGSSPRVRGTLAAYGTKSR